MAYRSFGAIGALRLVWDVSDTLDGMMVVPNLVALLVLARVVVGEKKGVLDSAG